jgi:hypothetical protein
LYRNNGEGRFELVSQQAGISGNHPGLSATWWDADDDGYPDLYVCNDFWEPDRFYHNDGDGTFTEQTEEAGLGGSPGKALGIAALDFNGDGWTDFVVANDTQRNLLYRNDGDGTFTDFGVESGVAFDENGRARAGMGVDAAVLDESGQPTIAIGNFSDEMVGLYRHLGNGLFRDRAPASGVGTPSLLALTFGLFFFDADLDGNLDLLLANGHIVEHIEQMQASITYRQPAQLFLGETGGTFKTATNIKGGVFERRLVGRGAAYADYDRDGDLDVLITENGGPVHLWRNALNPQETGSAHFLRVHLVGAPYNRDALGARLVAVAGGRRQERRVRTGGSYLSQSEKTATFGLGSATRVDTLLVYWPGGQVEVFEGVQADQELRLVEGRRQLEPLARTPRSQPEAGLDRR